MSNLAANEDETPGKHLVRIGESVVPCVYNVLQMLVHKLEAPVKIFSEY